MKNTQSVQLGYGDYLRFRDLVMRRSGLYFPDKKRNDLELGVFKALESSQKQDLDAYYHYLNSDHPKARTDFNHLINLLTIGETHFFRDMPQFNALASHVLPELIERKRREAQAAGTLPQLRLWSAGCASGEEPYSLAILLRELIPDISSWRILILGTDINEEILKKARRAVYSDWSFRESRALALRSIYFSREEKKYHLNDEIKKMVTFTRHNLIADTFPAIHHNLVAMDMIICRNVTIYFATETVQMLAEQFYETLVQGGWLIVGHSEPSMMIYRTFKAQTYPGTLLYQKTGEPTLLPDDWKPLTAVHQQIRDQAILKDPLPTPPPPPSAPSPPRRTGLLPNLDTDNLKNADPYHVARRLLSQGDIFNAIDTLHKNIDKLPDMYHPYAHCLLARAYADRGQWNTARQFANLAISENNLLPEPYLVLSMIDEYEKDLASAITNLKKVIYLDSRSVIAHFNLGMLYQREDRFIEARRALRNAQRLLQDQPPDSLIPDSGETTVQRLLETIVSLLSIMGDTTETAVA